MSTTTGGELAAKATGAANPDGVTAADLPDVFEVAVVVFARVNGVDLFDAEARAVVGLRRGLRSPMPLPHGIGTVDGLSLEIVGVSEVGSAAASGLLAVRPTGRAFRG